MHIWWILFALYPLILVISTTRIIPEAHILWDEGVFLRWISQMTAAIRHLDWSQIIDLSYRQFDYPPLQSWISGLILAPAGFTVDKARIVNFFWLIMTGILLLPLEKELTKHLPSLAKRKFIPAVIANCLLFTSPLIIYLATVALKEIMAACLTTAVLLFYLRARRLQKNYLFLLTGSTIALLFLTKYQYSIFLTLGLFLEAAFSWLTTDEKRNFLLWHLLIFFPPAMTSSLWLFAPVNRFSYFLDRVLNSTFNYTGGLTDIFTYLFFYPRGIVYLYSPAPAVGILILTAICISFIWLRKTAIRTILVTFILTFVFLTAHTSNVQERYLVTIMPAVYLIFTVMFTDLVNRLKIGRYLPFIALGIFLLSAWYIISPLSGRVFTVGSIAMKGLAFNLSGYDDSWFNYDQSTWSISPTVSGEQPDDVARFIVQNVDLDKPIDIIGRANEFSPDYFTLKFDEYRQAFSPAANSAATYTVGLEILPVSRYRTRDWLLVNAWIQPQVLALKNDPRLHLIAEKLFPELGVRVTVYTPFSSPL